MLYFFFLSSIHCFVIIKKGENIDLDPYLLMITKQLDDTNIFSRNTFNYEVNLIQISRAFERDKGS